jgi:hypothetical protein
MRIILNIFMNIRSLSSISTATTSSKKKNSKKQSNFMGGASESGFQPSQNSQKVYDKMRSIVGEAAIVLPKTENIMLSIEGNSR